MNEQDKKAFEFAWLKKEVPDFRGIGGGKTTIATIAVSSKRQAAELIWQAAIEYERGKGLTPEFSQKRTEALFKSLEQERAKSRKLVEDLKSIAQIGLGNGGQVIPIRDISERLSMKPSQNTRQRKVGNE